MSMRVGPYKPEYYKYNGQKEQLGRKIHSISIALANKFSNSIDVDSVLAEKDIIGSIAYAESLQEAGVINKSELIKINGLNQIKKEIETENLMESSLEDVHMNIESALEKKIGDSAKKLHTGRSRMIRLLQI